MAALALPNLSQIPENPKKKFKAPKAKKKISVKLKRKKKGGIVCKFSPTGIAESIYSLEAQVPCFELSFFGSSSISRYLALGAWSLKHVGDTFLSGIERYVNQRSRVYSEQQGIRFRSGDDQLIDTMALSRQHDRVVFQRSYRHLATSTAQAGVPNQLEQCSVALHGQVRSRVPANLTFGFRFQPGEPRYKAFNC
jgi:hypothetical protein